MALRLGRCSGEGLYRPHKGRGGGRSRSLKRGSFILDLSMTIFPSGRGKTERKEGTLCIRKHEKRPFSISPQDESFLPLTKRKLGGIGLAGKCRKG